MCTTCKELDQIRGSLNLDKKQITSELVETVSCTKPIIINALTQAQCAKRANRKAIDVAHINQLLKLDSPLFEQYQRTARCNDTFWVYSYTKTGKLKITANYCGKRWCTTCAARKTAELLSAYEHVLNHMNDPQFVTLTIVAVTQDQLKAAVRKMAKTFALCKDLMRKKGFNLYGIRKIECNYKITAGTFNPHFHLIIDGIDNAIELVKQWLKHNKGTKRTAQKIKAADQGTLKELFKYHTKQVQGKKIKAFRAQAQDAIYRAFSSVRTFQTFGNIRKSKVAQETIKQEKQEQGEDRVLVGRFRWHYQKMNWYDDQGKPIHRVQIRKSTKAIIATINQGSG
jgi:hypothetical protein